MVDIRKKRWQSTEKDLIRKLDRFGRCMMLRCTGFGKTWLMSKLTARLDLNGDLRYKHILYVYPSAVIRDTAEERIIQDHINVNMEDSIDRIEFVSYTWLSEFHR